MGNKEGNRFWTSLTGHLEQCVVNQVLGELARFDSYLDTRLPGEAPKGEAGVLMEFTTCVFAASEARL